MAARKRAERRGHRHVVVYADREHSANMSYLTGFDPRFEEAILVVGGDGAPAILVGNECYAMAAWRPCRCVASSIRTSACPASRVMAPDRWRMSSPTGHRPGGQVGVVGWKTMPASDDGAPAFLVDELRELVGATGLVEGTPTTCSSTPPMGYVSSTTSMRLACLE
jgi:hypothetical protein